MRYWGRWKGLNPEPRFYLFIFSGPITCHCGFFCKSMEVVKETSVPQTEVASMCFLTPLVYGGDERGLSCQVSRFVFQRKLWCGEQSVWFTPDCAFFPFGRKRHSCCLIIHKCCGIGILYDSIHVLLKIPNVFRPIVMWKEMFISCRSWSQPVLTGSSLLFWMQSVRQSVRRRSMKSWGEKMIYNERWV